jgi:hypothetical protein
VKYTICIKNSVLEILRHVAVVKTDVSEERIVSIIRVARIDER